VPALAIAKSRFAAGTGSEILFHTDAVQSYAKLPVDIGADGFHHVDLLSFSAHKIHGPKGVGALYAARPEKLAPLILGGGQENGVRSGTENVPGVAGFGAAAMEAAHGLSSAADRAIALRSRLLRGIEDEISDIRVNSPREASGTGEAGLCSPYILNVSFLGTRGEVVLHDLERRGVFVSTGSACASIGKGARKISPTLAALGLTAKEAEGAIRFGLSRYSSEGEIDYALEHLKTAVARFRKLGSFR
jgi:cysteine desulfurase